MQSLAQATAIGTIDSHTYSVDLQDDWAIGSVPHGGYVASCILAATQRHFSTVLSKQDQPHAIAIHLEYLRRTSVGPATITIEEKKIGRQTSVVHASLAQAGAREEVVGYITHSNLYKLDGLSLNTEWTLPAPEVLPVDLTRLGLHGEDENWIRAPVPVPQFRKAMTRYDIFVPRTGRQLSSVVDEWLRLKDGERFTNTMLGSVCDTFPLMVEGFMEDLKSRKGLGRSERSPKFWYPTLLLNLEVKKVLPESGAEWLFVRVRAKEIRNGRNDLDIVILDDKGELVAVSQHVAMIVDASRNLAKRSTAPGVKDGAAKL